MAKLSISNKKFLFTIFLIAITIINGYSVELNLKNILNEEGEYDVLFVGNDYFTLETMWRSDKAMIYKLESPTKPWKVLNADKDKMGYFNSLGTRVSSKNRLYFWLGQNDFFMFDPKTQKIGPVTNPKEVEDDFFVTIAPKKRDKVSVLFGKKIAKNYQADEKIKPYIDNLVEVPENFLPSLYGDKKYEKNDREVVNWAYELRFERDAAQNVAYSDKFKAWFQIEPRARWFFIAQQKDDGTWTGRRSVPSDQKNRKFGWGTSSEDENFSWKFLNPHMVIGPYSPAGKENPTSLDYSLEILNITGELTETDVINTVSFDVSPNGRYLITCGINTKKLANSKGQVPLLVAIYEISYQGTILDNSVRVRTEPNLKGKILTSLNKGKKTKVIERTEYPETIDGKKDCWYKVKLDNGQEGWIFGGLIELK